MNKEQENEIIERAFNNTCTDKSYRLELKLLQEIRDYLKRVVEKNE